MGCCLGRDRGSVSSDEVEDGLTVVKNKPLVFERIKWKSDVPMTLGQLRGKRDEFWDTAPAFDGRKEIWDALRAALNHAEQGDLILSQAILDGANISMPDGSLRESYDELGNRYQIPVYCLSAPVNLIPDDEQSESSVSAVNFSPPAANTIGDAQEMENQAPCTSKSTSTAVDAIQLKFRIYTAANGSAPCASDDIRVECRRTETIAQCKQRLWAVANDASRSPRISASSMVPPIDRQRWMFGGRILSDKSRLSEYKIPNNCVIQVVACENPSSSNVDKAKRWRKNVPFTVKETILNNSNDNVQSIEAIQLTVLTNNGQSSSSSSRRRSSSNHESSSSSSRNRRTNQQSNKRSNGSSRKKQILAVVAAPAAGTSESLAPIIADTASNSLLENEQSNVQNTNSIA